MLSEAGRVVAHSLPPGGACGHFFQRYFESWAYVLNATPLMAGDRAVQTWAGERRESILTQSKKTPLARVCCLLSQRKNDNPSDVIDDEFGIRTLARNATLHRKTLPPNHRNSAL